MHSQGRFAVGPFGLSAARFARARRLDVEDWKRNEALSGPCRSTANALPRSIIPWLQAAITGDRMREKIEVLLKTLGNAFPAGSVEYKHAESRHTILLTMA